MEVSSGATAEAHKSRQNPHEPSLLRVSKGHGGISQGVRQSKARMVCVCVCAHARVCFSLREIASRVAMCLYWGSQGERFGPRLCYIWQIQCAQKHTYTHRHTQIHTHTLTHIYTLTVEEKNILTLHCQDPKQQLFLSVMLT